MQFPRFSSVQETANGNERAAIKLFKNLDNSRIPK